MSELDDIEYEYTKEYNTGEIRNKDLRSCNENELRTRCAIDEQILRKANVIISRLEAKNKKLKEKIEAYERSYEANRDDYEEYE